MKVALTLSVVAVAIAYVMPQSQPAPVAAKKEVSLTDLITETSQAWGIDETLFRAIVQVESSGGLQVRGRVESHYLPRCRKALRKANDLGRPLAMSFDRAVELCASSVGPAQVMGYYALSLGIPLQEVEEPRVNLELAAHKLYTCHKRFTGDKAIKCYNGLGGDGSYVVKVKKAMRGV